MNVAMNKMRYAREEPLAFGKRPNTLTSLMASISSMMPWGNCGAEPTS